MWQIPTVFDNDWVETLDQGLSVYETDDNVVIEANVAGVPEENIDVSVEGGTITIKAEYTETEEEKNKKKIVYRRAREARYLYTASLPTAVDANKAKAEVKNGVLCLTFPKKEEAKPKKITVSKTSAK